MKKILRVDTGDKFVSVRECCRNLPISHKTLEKILETGETHPELGAFKFIEEFEPLVVILETGEQFETVEECAKKIGCNRTTLSAHLNGKAKQVKGYHVKYYKDYNPNDKSLLGEEVKEKKIRKVLCVETGDIFDSTTKCSYSMQISQTSISAVCNEKRLTAGGYHFKYVD